jgi:DNA-directed RNA polymerase subunit beta'
MTSKIKVKKRGDSSIFNGEYIDLEQIYNMNKVLKKTDRQEIIYQPVLLGITKASLTNESFIASSSFQETIRILSKAAILGKADWLRGLKENVIIGRLIPAGTGFNNYEEISHLTLRLPQPIKK